MGGVAVLDQGKGKGVLDQGKGGGVEREVSGEETIIGFLSNGRIGNYTSHYGIRMGQWWWVGGGGGMLVWKSSTLRV